MNKHLITSHSILAASACFMFVLQAESAWIMLDNFNGYDADSALAEQGNWSTLSGAVATNPYTVDTVANNTLFADAGNKALGVRNDFVSGGTYINFDMAETGAAITDGATGTLFFQYMAPANADTSRNFGFGVSAAPVLTMSSEQGGYLLAGTAPNELRARNGGTQPTIATSLELGTWYNLWMVFTNTTGATNATFDIYIQSTGSEGPYLEQTTITTGAAFRTNPGTDDIDNLFLSVFGADSEKTFIDNMYFSPGQNLTAVPEPSTTALIFGTLITCFVFWRRRMR